MTNFENLLVLFLSFILLITVAPFVLKNSMKYDTVLPVDKFPIRYPIEPAIESFADILQEIDEVQTERDLKAAYLRIIIFEGTYKKTGDMASDLYDAYLVKEIEIEKPS